MTGELVRGGVGGVETVARFEVRGSLRAGWCLVWLGLAWLGISSF